MKCPMCGAPASPDATACEHCGAKLATATCPSCFGMVFVGSKFCSHCGAVIPDESQAAATTFECPRCKAAMGKLKLGIYDVVECTRCEGMWIDGAVLQQICNDAQKQEAVAGIPATVPAPGGRPLEAIHYIPCPVCRTLMNRVNFGHCSGVVVDVCPQKHGTWFDKDELRRVVDFIHSGGLEKARFIQMENLKTEQARVNSAARAPLSPDMYDLPAAGMLRGYDKGHLVAAVVGDILKGLFG